MPGSFKKEDLRVKKTYKTLVDAMLTILNHKNFNQITVNDLCEEALISRATFYVHFNDKYDLLKYYLSLLKENFIKDGFEYDKFEKNVNHFVGHNRKVIENILIDANNEILELVNNFIAEIINVSMKKYWNIDDADYPVISKFCTGGILTMLLLHVKKNFPENNYIMTPCLYETLAYIMNRKKYEKDSK